MRIVFLGSERELEAPPGTSLYAAARRAGLPLGNACGARGQCRACAVLVVTGAESLNPRSSSEAALLQGDDHQTRLACVARVSGGDGRPVLLCCSAWGPPSSAERERWPEISRVLEENGDPP